ncbi:MAG TPA: flavodoxin family protein [Gemmatimonadaceae bacterium]|jgi:multimeric flavodoxin WrbA|nr:flavodoxin family protein [Gemmatimonadaceae bacterium]
MSETVSAIFLLGTLKKKHQLSHTQVLCDLVAETFREKENVESEIIRLRDYDIQPGTRTEVDDDDWPKILDRVLAADIIIFATPIWWGIQSSLMQRAIERMDELNDELLATGKSRFQNKTGGIVITGGEDGAEHIIGNILNFMSWNGFTIPPAPSVSWLGELSEETRETAEKKFRSQEMRQMAETFVRNQAFVARLLKQHPLPEAEE